MNYKECGEDAITSFKVLSQLLLGRYQNCQCSGQDLN